VGVGQELADGLPNRRFPLVRPQLGIRTDPLAPEPIGITPDTAIIGIGSCVTLTGTGTDRCAGIGIATAGAHQQPLEQLLGAALTLASTTAVLRQLLLDGALQRVID
jgi:hypothetical protein